MEPKTIWSNFLFSFLLSKFVMVVTLSMVISVPFLTGVFATTAHVSPSLVWRRR